MEVSGERREVRGMEATSSIAEVPFLIHNGLFFPDPVNQAGIHTLGTQSP